MKPEDTFRALQDQQTVNRSMRCRFGLHRWTVWSEPYQESGDLAMYRQRRTCTRCNITNRRYF